MITISGKRLDDGSGAISFDIDISGIVIRGFSIDEKGDISIPQYEREEDGMQHNVLSFAKPQTRVAFFRHILENLETKGTEFKFNLHMAHEPKITAVSIEHTKSSLFAHAYFGEKIKICGFEVKKNKISDKIRCTPPLLTNGKFLEGSRDYLRALEKMVVEQLDENKVDQKEKAPSPLKASAPIAIAKTQTPVKQLATIKKLTAESNAESNPAEYDDFIQQAQESNSQIIALFGDTQNDINSENSVELANTVRYVATNGWIAVHVGDVVDNETDNPLKMYSDEQKTRAWVDAAKIFHPVYDRLLMVRGNHDDKEGFAQLNEYFTGILADKIYAGNGGIIPRVLDIPNSNCVIVGIDYKEQEYTAYDVANIKEIIAKKCGDKKIILATHHFLDGNGDVTLKHQRSEFAKSILEDIPNITQVLCGHTAHSLVLGKRMNGKSVTMANFQHLGLTTANELKLGTMGYVTLLEVERSTGRLLKALPCNPCTGRVISRNDFSAKELYKAVAKDSSLATPREILNSRRIHDILDLPNWMDEPIYIPLKRPNFKIVMPKDGRAL